MIAAWRTPCGRARTWTSSQARLIADESRANCPRKSHIVLFRWSPKLLARAARARAQATQRYGVRALPSRPVRLSIGRRLFNMTAVERRRACRYIDIAVDHCELFNLREQLDVPRWIADLVVHLEAAAGEELQVPRDAIEAHGRLLDLRRGYMPESSGSDLAGRDDLAGTPVPGSLGSQGPDQSRAQGDCPHRDCRPWLPLRLPSVWLRLRP